MTFSPAFLDELRARTPLSTLVRRAVTLKKAGVEWKACCPFHNEKSASFYVNDAKAFYHCFGCGAHGDAIRWMTEHEGHSFVDAVKELAARAGLELPAADPQQADREREREEMLTIMRRAGEWFTDSKPGSDRAMTYLEGRGITPLVAQAFDIGFAPRGRGAPRLHEVLSDIEFEKLRKLGLAKEHEEGERAGERYDVFRGRLMFPIHDTRGRVIGFGGRILGQGEPKYLNSPDTPLFDKGRTLFNAHRAAPAARAASRLVIVEGYMDVIAMHRAGVPEAVAPNGTALTEHQIASAWRMADVPICCFDGDKPGRAAAARAALRALPMLEPSKSLSFVFPPDGKDPDDVLREGGAAAIAALLDRPVPLVDLLWEHERAAEPLDTPEQAAGFKTRMRAHVRSIRSPDVREAYGQNIAARFDHDRAPTPRVSPPAVRSSTQHQPFSRQPPPASRAQRDMARAGVAAELERAILIGLLHFPDLVPSAFGFRNHRIAALIDKIADAFALNGIKSEADAAAELERLGLLEEAQALTAGRQPIFEFARATIVSPGRAREALVAALAAMRK